MEDLGFLDDETLIERVRDGVEEAFAALWTRYYASAFNYACALVGRRRDDADDIVTDAYTKVWSALQRGRGPTQNFRAYLYATIRSVAVDRGPNRETPIDWQEPANAAVLPVGMAEPTPQLDAVARCFYALNQRYREVLWLSAVEGLKPADIGERLGMGARHASVVAMRARAAFSKLYAQAGEEMTDDQDEPRTAAPVGVAGRRLLGGVTGLAAGAAADSSAGWASTEIIVTPPPMPASVVGGQADELGVAASAHRQPQTGKPGRTNPLIAWVVGAVIAVAVGLGAWGVSRALAGAAAIPDPAMPPATNPVTDAPAINQAPGATATDWLPGMITPTDPAATGPETSPAPVPTAHPTEPVPTAHTTEPVPARPTTPNQQTGVPTKAADTATSRNTDALPMSTSATTTSLPPYEVTPQRQDSAPRSSTSSETSSGIPLPAMSNSSNTVYPDPPTKTTTTAGP